MPNYLFLCTIDQGKLDLFTRVRAAHYGFLIEHKHRILFGGPARIAEDGRPEKMLIVIVADSLAEAEAFIAAEPYNKHGGFSSVLVQPWTQVLPEREAGDLQRVFEAETSKSAGRVQTKS